MMKALFLFLVVLCSSNGSYAQYIELSGADTSDPRIKTAVTFLVTYLKEFSDTKQPDYTRYWSTADCQRSKLPDDMVYTIASDYPTYKFSSTPTIFYAKPYQNYIHLKTLFAYSDSSGKVFPWAITNHYIMLPASATEKPFFISELQLHHRKYKTITKSNITYHFPETHQFDKKASRAMIKRLRQIEKAWSFSAVPVHYYFAGDPQQLAAMRGMDYNFAMDETNPNGISYPAYGMLFCQGLGSGYLHEVLHLYFNTRYPESPLTHALVYYYAGGVGHDFDWIINRMNDYLQKYPDTDLTIYSKLHSKDRMLHIDHAINGLLIKMIDERNGVNGIKKAMAYDTTDELLAKEFGLQPKDLNIFLRTQFNKYAAAHNMGN